MNGMSLVILGAGGHGLVIADAASAAGDFRQILFLDDRYPNLKAAGDWEVRGRLESIATFNSDEFGIAVGIGRNDRRMALLDELADAGWHVPTIIHPRATVSPSAMLGHGTVVFANAVINPSCRIAEGCIVNTGATVDHECNLGRGVHVSPGVNIAGQVSVGDLAWLGIGSSVIQCRNIGARSIVGAGAVVVHDVPDDVTVVGVPAAPI